jgi:choline dehydrogenase-like flavoprotein
MDLAPKQRKALASIAATFCPEPNGVPSIDELGVVDAVVRTLGQAREAEQRQVAQLLGLWDTPVLTAFGGGGFRRFGSLPRERREQVLRSWCDSRLPQRRAAFQALRKASLLFYYMLPGPGGTRNGAWDAIGYPGPLGSVDDPASRALTPISVSGDMALDCDVVVVGSGAGGGTAAAVLAGAGLDVVVIEAGGYYDQGDFDGSEHKALTEYYMAAPSATVDQSVSLLAGACLGGGTVVNYTTSFRTPDEIRQEWASYGVPAFAGDEFTRSLDAVCARLGVNQDYSTPSSRDQVMQEGCAKLGWHIDAMPRNVEGCDQGVSCGYCGLGCRLGAKRSTSATWLVDAARAGARILVGTHVDRVMVERGAAQGVQAITDRGYKVTARARAVAVACGAIHTPALLRRSGLPNANIGKHLRLHPATAVFGVFDRELRPWEGTLQALYSDQHRNLDGNYGVKYETAPLQPHLFLNFAPWRGTRDHHDLITALPRTTVVGVLLRDRDAGEVKVGKDGQPQVRYRLSDFDRGHIRAGIEGACEILEAAGASRIYSSHNRWVGYSTGVGSRPQFMAAADASGYGAGQIVLGSFHIMGSARMGGSPATSACNPEGETWDVRDLYVCDGSTFPSASGVNPMISIESIGHMTASGMATRLT